MLNLSTETIDRLLAAAEQALNAGNLAQAESLAHQVLAMQPRNGAARRGLASLLARTSRFDEAVAHYRQYLLDDPQNAGVWFELARVLLTSGKSSEAIEAYQRALSLEPGHADAQHELGVAFDFSKRPEEAIAAFQRALVLNPRHIGAHNNLGNVYKNLGRLCDALECYQRALACNPEVPATLNNVGALLILMGRCPEAAVAYRKALARDPHFDAARTGYLYCRQFLPDIDARELFEETRQWQNFIGPYQAFTGHPNDRAPDRPLRVGYVSADFREHSVAYFIESLLTHHDRRQVEVYCYAHLLAPDAVTERIRAAADHWVVTAGLPEQQLAQRIHADGIDILVDLHGHTSGSRLKAFALKPAPIQVSYLGYPNTTGILAIDYRFTDAHADPVADSPAAPPDCFYSEKLIRLPETFLCYRPSEGAPAVTERQAGSPLTFASFNTLPKISPETVALWSRILRELPESHLLIKSLGLQDAAVSSLLLERFAAHGIAETRLSLVNHTPTPREHLGLYLGADIALDTFPYHGTTTTCEALWMGVPVITLAGESHRSRVGVSILRNAGVADLVARSSDEFVMIAVALARDAERRAELRRTLRRRLGDSPLLDAPRFARHVEAAYRAMWHVWCRS